jgi:pimeloyl-ACP methyl ester carboxylesterase
VRAYAADYAEQVAGVVLVDASHPSQWTSGAEARAAYQDIERMNGAFRLLGPTGVLRLTGYFGAPAELPARQAAELKAFLDSSQVAEINAAEFAATRRRTTSDEPSRAWATALYSYCPPPSTVSPNSKSDSGRSGSAI